jgi:hypothetical protein
VFTLNRSPFTLRPLVPYGSLIGCQSVQVFHHYLPPVGATRGSESFQCSYIYCSYSVRRVFFRFGRGRHLHNVLTFVFREGSTIPFTTSRTRAFLKILPGVLYLLRRNSSLRSRFLMPLLHSGRGRHFLPNVRPFWVLYTAFSWPCP